mmetsp:Transcript_12218/g.10516  ORF Transcript_12218/g.10516 Transcript_12218/m.10516 type:complete len:96 (-) Transcript_12218:670-957(-)
MRNHYEQAKKNVGIEINENYYEDNISDEAFAKIHPDAKFRFSDLLKNKLSYEEIKDFVSKHADDLGKAHKFYRKGKEVRPSSRAVTSTMSRTSPA